MCTGYEIAALAAAAAGTAMQANAAADAQAEQRRMIAATQAQQDQVQRRAEQTAADSTEQYTQESLADNAAAETSNYQTRYQQAMEDVSNRTQLPGAGSLALPQVIQDENARASDAASVFANNRSAAAARLAGLGQSLMNANTQTGRNAGNINMLGSFLNGNAGALNTDLAQVAPDANKMMTGQLMSGVGSALLGGALSSGGNTVGISPVVNGANGATSYAAKGYMPGISAVPLA